MSAKEIEKYSLKISGSLTVLKGRCKADILLLDYKGLAYHCHLLKILLDLKGWVQILLRNKGLYKTISAYCYLKDHISNRNKR